MQPNRIAATVALSCLLAASCSLGTSPASRALDGSWNTPGHGCLTISLNLQWTDDGVSGSGTYRTDLGPPGCLTPAPLQTTGTVALSAARPSATSVNGRMTFDGSANATFTGTLAAGSNPTRMDGTLVMPAGTSVSVSIYQGAVP